MSPIFRGTKALYVAIFATCHEISWHVTTRQEISSLRRHVMSWHFQHSLPPCGLNHGRKRLMWSCTWTIHILPLTSAHLSAMSITILTSDMWLSHAHVLKPCADCLGMTKSQPLIRRDGIQIPFNNMWLLMAADALSIFPDHNKWCDIYPDLMTTRGVLASRMIAEPLPITEKKVNFVQKNYTSTENKFCLYWPLLKSVGSFCMMLTYMCSPTKKLDVWWPQDTNGLNLA